MSSAVDTSGIMGDKKPEASQKPPKRARPNAGPNDWVVTNFDPSRCDPPSLEAEVQRLKTLKTYDILDVEPKECYQRITSLVSQTLDVPIALITFVDLGRTWFLAATGVPMDGVREVPRQESICTHAVLCRTGVFAVKDIADDERFCSNPFMNAGGLKFYAGAPLVTPGDGSKIGTVCVLDTKPHDFGQREEAILTDFAATVMDLLEQEKKLVEAEKKLEMLTRMDSKLEADAEPKEVEEEA